ncbi:DUF5999 family protein [Streptomyces sp. LP05-1]|uniref:DUF5999 family protein n=1 Tax=Streptomyces pyxinae TaxID=2970734 RepID=A0ABT2CBE8_9ACTN|nr:DUF5999 family protein [Streptomyces sp. LP05-1]
MCNGVVGLEDTGQPLPEGVVVSPHRPAVRAAS